MTARNAFYITTAISYPNGAPHIGHAYEAIATDALARFQRLDGRQVFFLTGTDEHGLKMKQTAERESLTPLALADRNAQAFQDMVASLGCSNDDFIRTSEQRHHAASQAIWQRMADNGDIYSDTYEGWYSVRDEAFYDEGETQLTEDGTRIGPQGTPVEWTTEETFFFRLSAYQDRLLAHYDAHPGFIAPKERRNEVVSFVSSGLRDLSVSRTTFDWGIKVPGADNHVMYVWVDALTNYLTGTGFPDETAEGYTAFWPADVHVIGKDIVRFHAVYWPAFLMSAKLALPKRVFAHGFLFNKGEKMSKSVGNVVDPSALLDAYGQDRVRFFFLREVPFGQDGSYSAEGIVTRCNADLANDLGNLAQRSLSMIAKNCAGTVPTPGALTPDDTAILEACDGLLESVRADMADQAIHKYLERVWAVISEANRYFAGQEPWALKKTDPERMGTVLYVTAEVIRQAAILAQPVTLQGAAHLLDHLQISPADRNFAHLGAAHRLAPGTQLASPTPAFPRYVEPE
ncbi:MAG: methionine--tRNA ligase [Pseudomonadota bacterium]